MTVPVIVFANQKGGVAKTTSADAVAEAMRMQGLKVLCVDMDPQGSLGSIEERYVADGTCDASAFVLGADIVPTPDGQATVPGDLALSNIDEESVDSDGNPVDELSLRRVRAAGLRYVPISFLRKTSKSIWAAAGVGAAIIQKGRGHTTLINTSF